MAGWARAALTNVSVQGGGHRCGCLSNWHHQARACLLLVPLLPQLMPMHGLPVAERMQRTGTASPTKQQQQLLRRDLAPAISRGLSGLPPPPSSRVLVGAVVAKAAGRLQVAAHCHANGREVVPSREDSLERLNGEGECGAGTSVMQCRHHFLAAGRSRCTLVLSRN